MHFALRHMFLFALFMVCGSVGVALAGQERVALEAHVGVRTSAVTAIRNALWQELPALYHRDSVVVAHDVRVGLPGAARLDRSYTSERFIDEVSVAGKAWTSAQFEKALKLLDAAIEHARRNPVVIAQSPAAQESMRRALLLLAMVHKRMSEEATDRMAAARGTSAYAEHEGRFWLHVGFKDQWLSELLRSFPDVPVTRNEIGREAEVVYQEAVQKHASAVRGWLHVRLVTPVPLVALSVNERSAPLDKREARLPGKYRVLLQAPGGARGYEVEVKAGQVAELVVDWPLDALLEGQEWIGFRFRSEDDRQHERALVARLLRGAAVRECAVFSILAGPRSYVVRGALYRADGQLLRRGEVIVEGPRSREPLRKLVAFLDGADDPVVFEQFTTVAPAVGASVARVAAVSDARSAAQRDSGAVPSRRRVLPVALIGLGTGAVIFGGVLYYYGSQPPPETPTNQATLFGSKPAGLATGLAGLAAIGAGWWLWSRPGRLAGHRAAPVVTLQPDGASFGASVVW